MTGEFSLRMLEAEPDLPVPVDTEPGEATLEVARDPRCSRCSYPIWEDVALGKRACSWCGTLLEAL